VFLDSVGHPTAHALGICRLDFADGRVALARWWYSNYWPTRRRTIFNVQSLKLG
jgi:hypothetical protein